MMRTLLFELRVAADTGPPPTAFPSWGSCCVRLTYMYPDTEPSRSVGGRAVGFNFRETDTNPSRAAGEGSVYNLPTPPIPLSISLPRGRTMEYVHICTASLITRYDDVWCWRALGIRE